MSKEKEIKEQIEEYNIEFNKFKKNSKTKKVVNLAKLAIDGGIIAASTIATGTVLANDKIEKPIKALSVAAGVVTIVVTTKCIYATTFEMKVDKIKEQIVDASNLVVQYINSIN